MQKYAYICKTLLNQVDFCLLLATYIYPARLDNIILIFHHQKVMREMFDKLFYNVTVETLNGLLYCKPHLSDDICLNFLNEVSDLVRYIFNLKVVY